MGGSMINKGVTGRWKEFIKGELLQRFEAWEQNWLEGTGLQFAYEIWCGQKHMKLDGMTIAYSEIVRRRDKLIKLMEKVYYVQWKMRRLIQA